LLEGYVVKLGTGEPVPRAQVVLESSAGQPASSLRTTTDSSGRFVFPGIIPGTYRLFASRDGFVRAEYGQRRINGTGIPITIASGQNMRDVVLSMGPTGAIAGRVYDRYGQPLVNATVRAMKFVYTEGRRTLGEFQSGRTNDLGEYRLYWLEPGQYIISIVPPQPVRFEGGTVVIDGGPGSPVPLNGGFPIRLNGNVASSLGYTPMADSADGCLPVYFPGTTDPAMATPIDLAAGANFTGVDVTITDARGSTVRGKVVHGLTGQLFGSQASLTPRPGTTVFTEARNSAVSGGTFEFRCVPPGSYNVVAVAAISATSIVGPDGPFTPDPRNTPQRRLFARVPVEVGGADIDDMIIALQPGFSISGRVTVEGSGAARPASGIRIMLRGEAGSPLQQPTPGLVTPEGTFTINDVGSGEFRLRVIQNSLGGFVKTARLAGTDVLNTTFRIDGPPSGLLEVVLSTNGGTLNATVLDERQQPFPNATVVLVPDPPHRAAFELYRSGATNTAGVLTLGNIPPGNYKVFAWDQVDANAWQYPDFIRPHEAVGTPVLIREGATETVRSTVIRAQ
jgi:hypothetical protein